MCRSDMKPPAFQFYADDFFAGTADMSQSEVGAYIRLLCHQWTKGGLPNDMARLGMVARTNNEPSNEAALRYVVESKFAVCDDGQLRNARMETVRKQSEDWKEKSIAGGKASAASRSGNSEWGKRMAGQRAKQRTNNEPPNEPPNEPTTNSPSPSPIDIKKGDRFVVPSLDEIKLNAAKIGLPDSEALKFHAFYESKGWMVGKNRMKSWIGAMSGWKVRWETDGRNGQGRQSASRTWTDEEMLRNAL